MKVVVIDYGSGNLRSVSKALELAASELYRGYEVIISSDPIELNDADHVILPGVGAFGDCYTGLMAIEGMGEALKEVTHCRGRPFLGICVGMQLMADRSLEHGEHAGLGWLAGEVCPMKPTSPEIKIPHMGWNELTLNEADHPVLSSAKNGDHAYFVHSFSMECANKKDILATTHYGTNIVAIVCSGNLLGTQFHPEKSQNTGLTILKNFLDWRP